MSDKYLLYRDINGGISDSGFGLPFASDNYTATLTANTAASVTVPDNFDNWLAVFSYEPATTVWVTTDGTAAVPAGATLAAESSQLNPPARKVKKDEVISVISADTTADISISFYAIGNNQ